MTIIRRNPEAPHCPPVDHDRELIHVDCASHTYPDGSVGIHEMCFYVLRDEIVALCGPNGSGKSNFADSLRWALGEQSYNLLRAKKTEDMIFYRL